MSNSKKKGYIGEYNLRKLAEKMGYDVVWHNEDPEKPDMSLMKNGVELVVECKYRKSVPKTIYDYINQDESSNCVIMKKIGPKNRGKKWLVVMELEDFDKIIEEKTDG